MSTHSCNPASLDHVTICDICVKRRANCGAAF
jgi:hypothetical protein